MNKTKEYSIDQIAGYEEEKKELKKIIDLFNNYEKYEKMGAYISKGLILSGPPGVGKTLFVKVLASEINAPLIYLDGSSLTGFFGERKIKKAFTKAAKCSPAIIFIDEINMLAGDDSYCSDFTKRNLSCLLKMIDGIKEYKDVFVIGASSYKEGLDEALLRSGRMDKHICIGYPNNHSRKLIFEYYLEKNEMIKEVDIYKTAELTSGMTGADIKTIVNEATLEAIRNNDGLLDDNILYSVIFKVKNQDLNRKHLVSKDLIYHDIGHLIVSYKLFNEFSDILTDDNKYIGNSSIAYLDDLNSFISEDDDDDEYNEEKSFFVTKNKAVDLIAVYIAGIVCEEIILGDVCDAGYNDINNAVNSICYMMGAGYFGYKYIFISEIGYIKPLVGNLRDVYEEEKVRILNDANNLAKDIILNNIELINNIYELYQINNSVRKEEVYKLLNKIK